MMHGMLTVNVGGKIQYWFISESKKRTYILISEEIKRNKKKVETKIIGWNKYPLIGWWIKD